MVFVTPAKYEVFLAWLFLKYQVHLQTCHQFYIQNQEDFITFIRFYAKFCKIPNRNAIFWKLSWFKKKVN